MKTISEADYTNFKKKVEKLPQENREKAYDELVSELERGLYLIGATAVLDRLQDFVPETIRDLLRASILFDRFRYKGLDVDWRQNGNRIKYR